MKMRLIWDFFGGDAYGTAAHHQIHLREFFENDELEWTKMNVGTAQKNHAMSWCEVDASISDAVERALKPQRRVDEPNFDKVDGTPVRDR